MDEQKGAQVPDLSHMLSQIMENPRALSMLTSLLGNATAGGTKPSADTTTEKPPIPLSKPTSTADENRRRLLMALKPFVSQGRRHAIDKILMITEALSLLQRKGDG